MKTVTRKVKFKAHTYLSTIPDPRDPEGEKTKVIRKVAVRDEEVEVTEAESLRGDELGAFYTEEDEKKGSGDTEEDADTIDFTEAGEDEIQEWIEEDEPGVKETVEAADGDPDVARRILAAEEATGDPRKGVVKALGAIINRDQ